MGLRLPMYGLTRFLRLRLRALFTTMRGLVSFSQCLSIGFMVVYYSVCLFVCQLFVFRYVS